MIQYLVDTKIPNKNITRATIIQIIALLLHGFDLVHALTENPTGSNTVAGTSDPMIANPHCFCDMSFPDRGFFISSLET